MSVEQFLVQPPNNVGVNVLLVLITACGIFLILVGAVGKLRTALRRIPIGVHSSKKYVYIVAGVVTIAAICAIFYAGYQPSTITVGSGYVDVKFTALSPIPFVGGEKNITSNEITSAYVGQIGSGNFTLQKLYGENYGDTNIGVYTLGNGATAYIASINSTDLIIQLKSGEYVIVGTSNTDALARSFSENVYELKLS